ncbi:E3 ubiquitin-protein ligase TRIM71 [Holothuria leucospilota]|uniref:E3 ubiquitin-protein ligase TRIM71 n=1 Tax=Holothuria leucospilota TaxID=206669 RepID=A0A9Q1BTF8_HOLLE|nr:E3 ubiquitin-protein ligase TRIM71 [Holothuria leucospilota]
MRDAPRCHIHYEEISKLFCETCSNLPVCMACTYGEHKGHKLHEGKTLAKLKREELAQKLESLEEIEKDRKLILSKKAYERLIINVNIEKEKVIKMHDVKDEKIMNKMQDIEGRRQQVKQEKRNAEKKIFDSLQREMENEMQEVKKKYEEMFKVKKIEVTDIFKARESFLEKELSELHGKRERFQRDKEDLLEQVEKELAENFKTFKTMSEHFDNIKKRLEALNVMASSILASDNDWSAVQCIPDMCIAATNLMKDLKKDFPEWTTLTYVTVNYKQYSIGKPSVTKISEQVEKEITITDSNLRVCDMTSVGDGNIVISGITPDREASVIIVIKMNGRIMQEKTMNTGKHWPARYCKSLSQHKVATVSEPNEIGLYDLRDGSYIKKNISDVTNSWPKDRYVRCVATDSVNNHILVGGDDSRDVYVFDNQLNYLHFLTLPEMIKCPRGITISDGHLLVCDYDGEKCYVTTMDRLKSKLVGELMKANLERNSFRPRSVCTDKNGFVYMLWKSYGLPQQCYLVQYNHHGSQVLVTRELDGRASVVTVVETSQGEKLLVPTYDTQTVYMYDLIAED